MAGVSSGKSRRWSTRLTLLLRDKLLRIALTAMTQTKIAHIGQRIKLCSEQSYVFRRLRRSLFINYRPPARQRRLSRPERGLTRDKTSDSLAARAKRDKEGDRFEINDDA